jgi:hypothetical protein
MSRRSKTGDGHSITIFRPKVELIPSQGPKAIRLVLVGIVEKPSTILNQRTRTAIYVDAGVRVVAKPVPTKFRL